MKTSKAKIAILSLVLICGIAIRLYAQAASTIDDRDITVVSFEEMKYPAGARAASIQGVVVIRVSLDNDGHVTEAQAICGAQPLISDAIANVKKWRFQPNSQKSAVVVYHFQMVAAEIRGTQFMLEGRNFATVTASLPSVR